MSGENHNAETLEPVGRKVGRTEHNWCRAVSCGTGVTVLAFQVSKVVEISLLKSALHKLLNAHPILKSKLHYNTSRKQFAFIAPATSHIQIKTFDHSSTSQLLQSLSEKCHSSAVLSPLHMIQEHELNNNAWFNPCGFPEEGMDMFFAGLYDLPGPKWIVTLRFHTAVCDQTTAVSLLRELMENAGDIREGGEGSKNGIKKNEGVNLEIEDLIPKGKTRKTFWAHGLAMLEYSVNSLMLTNLKFKDIKGTRCSQLVRLQMNPKDTSQVLAGCKSRGIKLCGAIAAAGLIAAHSSQSNSYQQTRKYGVVTLMDCRSILDPALTRHSFGFYHSAILNIHAMKGGENLWELATRTYTSFENSKKCNKHFSDMADLNFLMCKAIENPSLTASSSLRTSLISVFEDPVFDKSSQIQQDLGLEDYIGCASVHGVGPSIAVFDTIRDGQLDCACVYPSPLHSREQMQELVDNIKKVLIDAPNL